jgi:CHAD domain-containing protein
VTLPALAAEAFAKLGQAVDLLDPNPSEEALHAVRIRGKRARYAAELAEASVGKRAGRFLRRAKAFQDLLGDHQDAHVAETRLRAFVAGVRDVRAAFATGRLVERQRARRAAARAAFPDAWRRLAKAGRKAWA